MANEWKDGCPIIYTDTIHVLYFERPKFPETAMLIGQLQRYVFHFPFVSVMADFIKKCSTLTHSRFFANKIVIPWCEHWTKVPEMSDVCCLWKPCLEKPHSGVSVTLENPSFSSPSSSSNTFIPQYIFDLIPTYFILHPLFQSIPILFFTTYLSRLTLCLGPTYFIVYNTFVSISTYFVVCHTFVTLPMYFIVYPLFWSYLFLLLSLLCQSLRLYVFLPLFWSHICYCLR